MDLRSSSIILAVLPVGLRRLEVFIAQNEWEFEYTVMVRAAGGAEAEAKRRKPPTAGEVSEYWRKTSV